MHNTKLFATLVFLGLALVFLVGFKEKFVEKNQTGSPTAKKESEVVTVESDSDLDESALSLEVLAESLDKKKFETWYKELEVLVNGKRNVLERLESLREGIEKIEQNRQQLQNLNFNEEIEIDFMIKPLKLLPKKGDFDARDCGEYKFKILSHFDTTSEGEISDPSLKKALGLFELICPR